MAQECFCGCGRSITGFADRGMNKQGRRTVELIERCRETGRTCAHNKDAYEGDIMPVVELLENKAQEGDAYAEFWAGAVHGTDIPPPSEARAIKKQWVGWGKDARRVAGLAELPPEKLQAVIAANQ